MTKRRWITAAELDAKLMADPEWMARKAERDRIHNEKVARLRKEQEPILNDLKAIGYNLETVAEFINSPNYYETAIPILIKHLAIESYSDPIRETIARALAMKEARHFWPILRARYQEASNSKDFRGYKDGLALALAATVTDKTLDEMIDLIKDTSNGSSRIFFIKPLMKSKSEKAKQVIDELADDPDLKKEIASKRRKKKASA